MVCLLYTSNWGVMGVAVATVISRVVNLIIVAGMGAVLIKAKQSPEPVSYTHLDVYKRQDSVKITLMIY